MARDLYPTKHSIQTMRARKISWADVVEVANNPEVTYGPDLRGVVNYQKGKLCVLVSKDGAVVTVLLRKGEKWTDEDARNR